MNTAVINIKVNPKTKLKAQEVASALGISLSSLINAYLIQMTRMKSVAFSLDDNEPTDFLLAALKRSKRDIKTGKISPSFKDSKKAVSWLKKSKKNYDGKI